MEHWRKLQSLKAERTKTSSPLTQTPVGMKYLAQGNTALYINLLLMACACSCTHLRFIDLSVFGEHRIYYLLTTQNVSLSLIY